MTDFGISPEQLKRLAALAEESGLSELRYEAGEFSVTVRTAAHQPASPTVPLTALPLFGLPHHTLAAESAPHGVGTGDQPPVGGATDQMRPQDTPSPHGTTADDPRLIRIEAPLMGTFWRSPSPDDPPFIEVGDTIEAGQVIGLIEAMKIFSEVPAEVGGRVRDIPAKSKALVQPGDILVILEPVE